MRSECSSSSEEDDEGDAERRAAIASIVATSSFTTTSTLTNGVVTTTLNSNHSTAAQKVKSNPQNLNYSQIRAQKILDSILEKTLEIVSEPAHAVPDEPDKEECGVRLFRYAPIGIVFDHRDEIQGPKKRPTILPGEKINKKSKKFRRQIQSVVVDGMDIISAAKDACEKSLSRLREKEARAKAAAQKEEERVAELKRMRGEKWLPSIAGGKTR